MFGEGPTYGLHGTFCSAEENFSTNLLKEKQTFVWVCIVKQIIVISLLME